MVKSRQKRENMSSQNCKKLIESERNERKEKREEKRDCLGQRIARVLARVIIHLIYSIINVNFIE